MYIDDQCELIDDVITAMVNGAKDEGNGETDAESGLESNKPLSVIVCQTASGNNCN